MSKPPKAFLWICKDRNSEIITHSTGLEATLINRHAQIQRARSDRKARKESKSFEKPSTSTSPKSQTGDDVGPSKPLQISRRRPDETPMLQWPSGNHNAVDPFDCTSLELDNQVLTLLEVYKIWWNRPTWGWVWGSPSKQYNKDLGTTSIGSSITLNVAMTNVDHMHSLLAYVTSLTKAEIPTHYSHQQQITMVQRALRSVQARLLPVTLIDAASAVDLLLDVTHLCLGAFLHGEYDAASAHLTGAQLLITAAGGLLSMPRYLSEMLIFSNYSLALRSLSYPSFSVYDVTTSMPPDLFRPNPRLNMLANEIMASTHWPAESSDMQQLASDILICSQLMEAETYNPQSSNNPLWTSRRIQAVALQCLSMNDPSPQTIANYGSVLAYESTRTSFPLWCSLLIGITLHDVAPVSVLPSFSDDVINAYKQNIFLHNIGTILSEWNITRQALSIHGNNELSLHFPKFQQLISRLEGDGIVKLGPFMNEFFNLERQHRSIRRNRERVPPPSNRQSMAEH